MTQGWLYRVAVDNNRLDIGFRFNFMRTTRIFSNAKGVGPLFRLRIVESASKTHSKRFVPMWGTTFPRNTHAGFVSKFTNPAYYPVKAIVVKSLQNPAWVFRGNVVPHIGFATCASSRYTQLSLLNGTVWVAEYVRVRPNENGAEHATVHRHDTPYTATCPIRADRRR